MKLFGLGTLGTLVAVGGGLAAGWTVALADGVARDAFCGRWVDAQSLRGLGRGFLTLAGGKATTARAKQRRGVVDTIVSHAVFLTLARDGLRRHPRHTRLLVGAGGVAALSLTPFLPRRHSLAGAALAFVTGAAAAVVMSRIDEVVPSSPPRGGDALDARDPDRSSPSTHLRVAEAEPVERVQRA